MDLIDEAEAAVAAVVHDAEELFPPKPGGLVDRHRQRKAAEEATRKAGEDGPEEELASRARAIRVDDVAPESAGARTFVISTATGPKQVLPGDPSRRRAMVLALDQPVVITPQESSARDPGNASTAAGLPATGFVLPVNLPVVIWASCQWWAAPTSATAGRVSVITELRSIAG